ncbi:MAG: ATP:cob(I)alamin adenosyltransferase [Parcubacteria group bacterium CG11_big_fil_rev_8_21_14_0_20_39_22]|nr:MAG: ATP:cob(I)alamin adenosyltransferase [Parcubacteria group bacterium CG11_big_fil_rev_8_21_14_0_20_39_22]
MTALFTGRGDDGTTKTFGKDKPRIKKDSWQTEALGACDELNSFLGICKVKARHLNVCGLKASGLVHMVQESLFIIQAELAGADKSIDPEKVKNMETIINAIEKKMPPIKSFFISGGTDLASHFDVARTLARKAERRIIGAVEAGEVSISDGTKSYINRLSSLLYALARFANFDAGVGEKAPSYN